MSLFEQLLAYARSTVTDVTGVRLVDDRFRATPTIWAAIRTSEGSSRSKAAEGDRRSRWTGRDVLVAAGAAGVVLVVVAISIYRGPVARHRSCSRYQEEFRRELDEGRLKYARITERLAAEDGCSWARREP